MNYNTSQWKYFMRSGPTGACDKERKTTDNMMCRVYRGAEAINDKCYTCGRHNILVIVRFVALCLTVTIGATPASYILSPLGDPTLMIPITEL